MTTIHTTHYICSSTLISSQLTTARQSITVKLHLKSQILSLKCMLVLLIIHTKLANNLAGDTFMQIATKYKSEQPMLFYSYVSKEKKQKALQTHSEQPAQ